MYFSAQVPCSKTKNMLEIDFGGKFKLSFLDGETIGQTWLDNKNYGEKYKNILKKFDR